MALLEIKEVLRHWLRGRAKRLIARRLGLDVKTVRNYVRTAEELGLTGGPETALTDEVLFAVVTRVYRRLLARPRSEGWRWCASHDDDLRKLLEDRISVSEIRRILERRGVHVSASTLRRFIVSEFPDGPSQGDKGEYNLFLFEEIAIAPFAFFRRTRLRDCLLGYLCTVGRARNHRV